MKVAIRALKRRSPREIVVAFPVAPADTLAELAQEADQAVCLSQPAHFPALSYYYRSFPQLSDEEVVEASAGGCTPPEGLAATGSFIVGTDSPPDPFSASNSDTPSKPGEWRKRLMNIKVPCRERRNRRQYRDMKQTDLFSARPDQGLPHGRGRGARACAASISTSTRARSSCCSARRAAASRRCSTSWAGSIVPTSGEVRFRDQELTARRRGRSSPRYRREHVGFVFQFYNLIPSLTARENVALVTEIARDPMPPEEALELVGLAERMDHFPGATLRRRAAARGHRPRHRQAAGGAAVRRADRRARLPDRRSWCSRRSRGSTRELGTTTAIITHNAAIAGMAHRVLTFSDGRIVGAVANEKRAQPAEVTW